MALASDGSLFTWGGGKYGQLGHASLHAVNVMVPDQPIVLATPHKIAALEPANLKPWRRVTSIAAGRAEQSMPACIRRCTLFLQSGLLHRRVPPLSRHHCVWCPADVRPQQARPGALVFF
jgi:hypothetical protein